MAYKFSDLLKFCPEFSGIESRISVINPKKVSKKDFRLTGDQLTNFNNYFAGKDIPSEVQACIVKVVNNPDVSNKYKTLLDAYIAFWAITANRLVTLSAEIQYSLMVETLKTLIFDVDGSIKLATTAEMKYLKNKSDDTAIANEIAKRSVDKEKKKWTDRMNSYH